VISVSQRQNADLVHAARCVRFHGYIIKTDAGTELLPAIEAVLLGGPFHSSGLESDAPVFR